MKTAGLQVRGAESGGWEEGGSFGRRPAVLWGTHETDRYISHTYTQTATPSVRSVEKETELFACARVGYTNIGSELRT